MSLNGYSRKIAAEKLGINKNTLTNYMSQDLIPRVKVEGLSLIPELTMKNLLWMQSRGIPLTKYLFTDLPHDDGFKNSHLQKVENRIEDLRQYVNVLYAGRQSVKYGERDFDEISRTNWHINIAVKRRNQILGILNKPTSSGMGDPSQSDMFEEATYVKPKYIQLDGHENDYDVLPTMYLKDKEDMSAEELRQVVNDILQELKDYEAELGKKDKGYTGRTIQVEKSGTGELIQELQKTIAEQEEKLETEYRRDKANNLKLYELKELLKEKQKELEEYINKYTEALTELEKTKNWSEKFTEQLEYERKSIRQKAKSKRTSNDNVKLINATPIDNKGYTKEEDDRLKEMLNQAIIESNKPK